MYFHPLQFFQSYLRSQITNRLCANPVSQRRTHNLREVHVGACLAQSECQVCSQLGLVGERPWLQAFLLPFWN